MKMKKFFKITSMVVYSTIFTLLVLSGPNTEASPIKIDWVGGSSGPRNDVWQSDSWDNYRSNVIIAVKNNLNSYDTQATTFSLISDLSNGSTILELMDSKVATGDFSYSGKQFDFGFFIESINDINHDPENNTYWIVLVNGQETDSGVSDEVINNGDIINFSLDSASNDKVIIKDNLGEYFGVLGTEINAYWEGKFLDIENIYPVEKGHMWNEIVWITSTLGATFVPEDVSITTHIEKYDYNIALGWVILKTESADLSDQTVIVQSFTNGTDNTPGTEDDVEVSDNTLPTESFIFSSNGINFLPPPPPTTNKLNEEYYVNMTHHGLLDGKYRFRFVLEIPFEHSDGSPGTITDTKIVYKAEKEIDQNLINKIISIGVSSNSESDNVFDINFSFESINENDLIKIEHSSDLENWSEFGWKHGSGLLEQSVEGKENFFRGVIY
jgi:hypothetical protein